MKRIEELIRLRAEGKGGYPAWRDCPLTKCPVFRECAKDCCQMLKAIQDMEREALTQADLMEAVKARVEV